MRAQRINPLTQTGFDALVEDFGEAKAHDLRVAAAQRAHDDAARLQFGCEGRQLDQRHYLSKQLFNATFERSWFHNPARQAVG